MDQWTRAQLTPARRPAGNQTVLAEAGGAALYDGSRRAKHRQHGTLFVLPDRVVWAPEPAGPDAKTVPCQLALKLVTGVADPGKDKIRLEIGSEGKYCQVGFRKGGCSTVLARLQTAVRERSWEKSGGGGGEGGSPASSGSSGSSGSSASRASAASEPGARGHREGSSSGAAGSAESASASAPAGRRKAEFSTKGAGISGIMDRMEKKHAATNATMQVAFQDLDSLMEKAAEMVKMADAFALKQASAAKEGSGADSEGDEMRSMLVQLGIAAPVTKDAAGSKYHQQLARQLSEWLAKFIDERFSGMIAITDLYCLFNRARGTEMISPDDLMKACAQFERLNLPMRLRTFATGVSVVQSAAHSDESVARDLSALIKRDGPITPYDVATRKKIPLPLAQEQLCAAERAGAICRDETMDGVTFFLNFFADMEMLKFHTT
jgi:EAP30/Vps36 family